MPKPKVCLKTEGGVKGAIAPTVPLIDAIRRHYIICVKQNQALARYFFHFFVIFRYFFAKKPFLCYFIVMPKNLVIVESPAKAKTIEKYLGSDFKVLSSVGHIRKDTKIDPEHDFTVTYEIDPNHAKIVSELKKAVKSADTVWLATDEDREGESISWHLSEVLDLPKNTHRITFHEITKPALEDAIKHPRTIDQSMVESQQARQSLDMLVGYDLSGVIRKKVPGAKSAGRVQSPAVKLVVEKEREIEKFDKTFNFKITGEFDDFTATANITPNTDAEVKELFEKLKDAKFEVTKIEKTEGTKANPTPLTTAAMQIEASSRLGFSASTTMRAAQALYQAGLITYHRTDSLNLSNQAIASMASYIEKSFGKNYLKTRHFKTKSAGAQEAHEAIRPTDITRTTAGKNDFEKKLYHLIWSRTLATQMANARVAKTTIDLVPRGNLNYPFEVRSQSRREAASDPATAGVASVPRKDNQITLIAKGEIVIFDGFLKVYGKSKDTELPELSKNDILTPKAIIARQTFAKPPARYTEGSLVKKLEELGIGRPSTYAGILSAIQARNYVHKGEGEGKERQVTEIKLANHQITESSATKGKLLPTPVGELISDFLDQHFNDIVDYSFTADIEKQLDLIAEQKLGRVKMLKDFYVPFEKSITASDSTERFNGATKLGTDPKTNQPIYAKIGKNGGFIQLGDNEKETGKKPRFAPLPKGATTKTVTLEQALKQLALPALPRSLGHAKDGTELIAASGPFGPYLKAGKYNIPTKDHDPYTISLAEAQPIYQKKIDSIIADWGDIMIINGAYGPYIKGPGRRNNVKIDKDEDPHKITKQEAEERLKNKKSTPTRRGKRGAKNTKKAKKSAKSTTK